ncbi:MAG: YceI family protein [Sediminibacterium sp.]
MISKPITILLLLMTLQPAAYTQQLPQTYQLDIKKSKILWNTGKLMGGHHGYFLFNSGSLQYSATGEPLTGFFSMDMNSIRSTDNPKEAERQRVDGDLRKEDFFASDQYPAAVMNVKKIIRIGSSTNFKVAGELTIKGITNPIEFTATVITKDNTVHITANVDIQRQLWNIHSKPQANNSLNFLSAINEKLVPDIHVALDLILNK